MVTTNSVNQVAKVESYPLPLPYQRPVPMQLCSFGVSAAPAIFQCMMESILQGFPNLFVYLDDILVTGESHLRNLEAVLSRLEDDGVHLKQEKCEFKLPQVEYLHVWHRISANCLQPTAQKVC